MRWGKTGWVRGPAYWAGPWLVCLFVHQRALATWFWGDDFAWLGVGMGRDLWHVLFAPLAQGTIRPWSERAFFMAGFGLFGMDPLPFRIVVFATQFANLALVAWIGSHLTGSRAAGFLAAVFWAINGALVEPLGWTCVYNQVLCGFFMLVAFHFLLRYVDTGRARWNRCQWIAFLLGFGALELNLVYPALAAAYTFLCARRYFRRTLPLFVPSAVFAAVHYVAAPPQQAGDYALHFTGSLLSTLATYWAWSIGPALGWTIVNVPPWVLQAGIAVVSVGLLWSLRTKLPGGLFCVAWYVVTIAPALPLRDHPTEYYVYLPLAGICWLGGWALAEVWRAKIRARIAAAALALLYVAMVLPRAMHASAWNCQVSMRVRNLVEGVARAHELHPRQTLLLDGVDTYLFWNGVFDHPFRLDGIEDIYLSPGSERLIDPHPDLGNIDSFVLPPDIAAQALQRGELAVYDVRGPRLRNITAVYAARPLDRGLPSRVEVSSPLAGYLLGPEWYPVDGNHRWMPRRATVRMAAPRRPGERLYVRGYCPDEQLRGGPLTLSVTVDGATQSADIRRGENSFERAFPLPAAAVGTGEMVVVLEVNRVFFPASDRRELGVTIEMLEER